MNDLETRIAQLSPEQLALLAQRLAAGRQAESASRIPRRRPGEAIPLSFAQERLWFFEQFHPGSSVYNMLASFSLRGPVEARLMARAVNEVVRRHEVLRTTFDTWAGKPVQIVAPDLHIPLIVLDLSEGSGGAPSVEVARHSLEALHTPFSLESGPLVRALLLHLPAGESLVLLTMHHIVCDGWSMKVLLREIQSIYQALARGLPAELPQLPIQYGDFAAWQRAWLSGPVLEELLAYWRNQLHAAPPLLELPTDRPRPAVQTFAGATRSGWLPAELAPLLSALGQRQGSTLFMTLMAGFLALLHLHTGVEDLVVGTPVAGRNRAEIEGLIGFFVNTLVLRVRARAGDSFRALLERVRETALDAFAHQDLPVERLVEELHPERDLSRNPLFQVSFALQNTEEQAAAAPPSGSGDGDPESALSPPNALQDAELTRGTAKFDLALAMAETPRGLVAAFEYSTSLYDDVTIARLAGQLANLLAGAAAAPEDRLSALPLLSPHERHQLLHEWSQAADSGRGRGSGASSATGEPALFHQLFEEQAARTPEATALLGLRGLPSLPDQNEQPARAGPAELTYGELDRRCDRLARRLRALGVGPEVRVGLCLERSPELVLGLLATLKAGGAFVPLDPRLPRQRLELLGVDSAVALLLVDAAGAARLEGQLPSLPRLSLAPLREVSGPATQLSRALPPVSPASPAGQGSQAPPSPLAARDGSAAGPGSRRRPGGATAGDLAYVIYTSGSTGQPKGVALCHAGLGEVALDQRRLLALRPGHRVLQLASPSFDASVFEVALALTSGAALIVPAAAAALAGDDLMEVLRDQAVTHLTITPSALASLGAAELPALEVVLSAGEPCPPELVARWAPGRRFYNGYGPTEATICISIGSCQTDGRRPAAGRPVVGRRVFVVRGELVPVPAGAVGEVVVGGACVARGYLGRPALTAAGFVPDPFAERPGERLYRTGDLGRFLATGELEILGRADQQVKVRGFRVELGEIEAALLRHPGIRAAAAAALPAGTPGAGGIAAYLVAGDTEPPGPAALRQFLRETLPEHMVPSAFVMLPELPLTPLGKVDRRALPAPEARRPELAGFAAARGQVEEILAAIWAEVLQLDRVGVHDDFFELGGHSLLATQVVSRIREALRVELPLRALFLAPTIAGLAERVEQGRGEAHDHLQPPPLTRVPRTTALPLSFAQERLWFLDRLDPGSVTYNMPAAMRVQAPLNLQALQRTLDEIVRRHEVLRTTFSSAAGRPVQVIAPPRPLAIEVIDLRESPHVPHVPNTEREAEVARLAAAEAQRPFDLVAGPLLRARVVRIAEADSLLLLGMHHIVSDGWSMDVFYRELKTLYEAFCALRPSPLPELAIQYADFAHWQRGWLSGAVLAAHLAYWRDRLDGAPPLLELPTDRPRPPVQTFRGAMQLFEVAGEAIAAIEQLGQREGVTLFMTLLAAWSALLARWSGQPDVVVGSPIANRTRAELEPLIGLFVNTLVLRNNLAGDPTFREALAQVREVTLGAYAHQHLPFEKLVDELQPQRSLGHNPLFQVMLVLQNTPELARAAAESFEAPPESPAGHGNGSAKFDLTASALRTGRGLLGSLEYRVDLFDATTIARLARHLGVLLEAAAGTPDLPLSALPWLTAAEVHQALREWNDLGSRHGGARGEDALAPIPPIPPITASLHRLFEEQARRTPSAIALECASPAGAATASPPADRSAPAGPAAPAHPSRSAPTRLSYRELDAAAERLARRLRREGVGAEVVVGICLERTAALPVALLAVLKAGGAYLPLDPGYPSERLALMLRDSGAALLLTQEDLLPKLAGRMVRTLLLDAAEPGPGSAGRAELLARAAPIGGASAPIAPSAPSDRDSLAYVIYTSGSTGRPKGVAIEHRAAAGFVRWALASFAPGPGEAWLAATSICFDLSIFELFVPLAAGARVVLVQDALALADLGEEAGITLVNTVPSAMAELLRCGALPRSVHTVNLAGEPLPGALAREIQARGHVRRLCNLYGPTEATTYATLAEIRSAAAGSAGHGGAEAEPAIGRPIPGTTAYVLDRELRPLPIGAVGEIYLGGGGLARGYLHRPELTAERFIPDPCSTLPGARLYRTGDLARLLAPGEIFCLGRGDAQVKVRGFRIELGEVEAALGAWPGVVETCVVARPDAAGGRRLVAYLVLAAHPDEAPPHDISRLRDFLKERLPEFMVPSAFVLLAALPRTANGKLDRQALPEPEADRQRATSDRYVAPEPGIEQALAGIWTEVLEIANPGAQDDFFKLGGHSLLATQVVARIRDQFGVEVPLRSLFESPTIRELAGVVARAAAAVPEPDPASGSPAPGESVLGSSRDERAATSPPGAASAVPPAPGAIPVASAGPGPLAPHTGPALSPAGRPPGFPAGLQAGEPDEIDVGALSDEEVAALLSQLLDGTAEPAAMAPLTAMASLAPKVAIEAPGAAPPPDAEPGSAPGSAKLAPEAGPAQP